ncbi:lambda exonuclease family protein [Variovorax atrisoli]|uniref:lambda exonuclease family protein n=1 Tax=Variovorax atrisoli TaxID=3394203 RepID=UPI00404019C8
MILLNHPQGSEDWLRARCGVATASRFSEAREKVGGLTDQQRLYVEALQLGMDESEARAKAGYKQKPGAGAIAKALKGEPTEEPGAAAIKYAWLVAIETISREPLDDTFVTYAMRRGRDLEPRARMVYERRTGALVEEVSLILTDDERFGYSSDGLIDDDGMVEIKCPLACDKLGQVWASPETAHLEYIDQINGGLWITGRQWCDLVVYCPWLEPVGKDLFVKRIYRNEDAIAALEADLIGFMRLVDSHLEVLRTPTKMSGAPKVAPDAPAPAGALAPSPALPPAAELPLFPEPATPARCGHAVVDNPF